MKKAPRVTAVLGAILFLLAITGCSGGGGDNPTLPPTTPEGQGWYPGIIHAHSTFSDGDRTPEQLVSNAKDAGVCFLVVTDHYEQIDEYGFSNYRSRFLSQISPDFVVIPGAEICTRWATDSVDPADSHTLALGDAAFKDDILFDLQCEADTQQKVTNRLNELNLLPVAAHPSFVVPITYPPEWEGITNGQFDPMGVNGIKGFEFFNDGSTEGYQRTLDWYLRLLRQGNDIFVTSGCDSHRSALDLVLSHVSSNPWTRKTWVFSEKLEATSFLSAIAQGRTYAANYGASFEKLNYIPGFQSQEVDVAKFLFKVKFENEVSGDKTVRIYRDGNLVPESVQTTLKDTINLLNGFSYSWEDIGVEGEHQYIIEVEGVLITSPIRLTSIQENSHDLTGIWKGSWQTTGFPLLGGNYKLTITQYGTSVSGIADLDYQGGWAIYKVEGSITSDKLKYRHTLLDSYTEPGFTKWCSSLDYTFSYQPGATVLDGIFKCNVSIDHTGKCHLEKQ